MALTDVKICQKALTLLGAEQIQSLNEENDRSKTCNLLYPEIKKDALSQNTWNFATAKRELNKLAQDPINEYDNQFDLPNDMVLGPIKVFSNKQSRNPTQRWKIANNKLMTNKDEIYMDYVANVDEHRFPSYFTKFLYHALAAELAKNITDQTTTAQFYYQMAYGSPNDNKNGGLLGKAKLLDSQTQTTQVIDDNPINDARWSS